MKNHKIWKDQVNNMDEKQRLLKLQEDLEAGNVFEEDLSQEDTEKLEELYKEQISLLKEMKEVYQKKIEFHKENIKKNLDTLNKLKKN